MYVDSHCHIYFDGLVERMPEILANMQASRVTHALCASVDLETLPRVLALAEAHPNLFASVGVHPDHEGVAEPSVAELVELARHPKIVAIGETGLDYYRLGERTIEDMAWQRDRFRRHIQAARQSGKPLIIHTRASAQDTLRLLREEDAGAVGGVMHCFTESWEVAQAALDIGLYISLSGIVTFKSATDLQEVARRIPADRLLIETDSPYLAPVPFRGKTNEPAHVSHVGNFVAGLRGIDAAELGALTTQNFFNLFRDASAFGRS